MRQLSLTNVSPYQRRTWRGPVARAARLPAEVPGTPAGFASRAALVPLPVTGVSGISIAPALAGPSIRATRAADCLSVSQAVSDAACGQGTALGPVLDATTAVRPFYARPGLLQQAAAISSAYASGFHPRLGLISAGVPVGDGGGTALGGALDSGSARLNLGHLQGGIGESATIMVGDGLVSVGGGASVLHNGVLSSYAGAIMGWRDYIGVQATWFNLDTATGELAFAGGAIAQSADRTVSDLGACPPEVAPQLVAARGLARGTALHRMEIHHARALSVSVRGMFGHLFIALQGRLGYSRGKDANYRLFVPEKTARKVLFERGGMRRFFRDKARALRWRHDRVRLPELAKPEALALGDEMTHIRAGAWICSLLAGNLAAWTGGQVSFKGDLAIRVRKIDTHVVEVMYTPLTVKSIAWVVTGALGVQATLDRSRARALRQVFTFDLRHAAARRAYQKALDGRLPGALPSPAKTSRGSSEAMLTRMQEALREEAALLPDGVARVYAHGLTALQRRRGGGFHLYLIPRVWLPEGWEPGWMRHRIRLHESEAVVAADCVSVTETRTCEARSEQGWRGLRSRRAGATVQAEIPEVGAAQRSVTLEATLAQGRIGVEKMNREMLAVLNRQFRLNLPEHRAMAGKCAWRAQVCRTLDITTVQRLAASGKDARETPRNRALRLSALAARCGVPVAALSGFVGALGQASDSARQVHLLQTFVQRQGIGGMAAVHDLTGDGADALQVTLLQSGYEADAALGARLALKYGGARPCTRKSRHAQCRELRGGIARMRDARDALHANRVLPCAARIELSDALENHQRVLEKALNVARS